MQGTIHVDDDSPTSNAHGHLQPDVMSSAASVHAQPAINALAMLRRETVAEGSWPMSSSRRSSSWTLRPIPARRSKEPAVDPMTRSDGEWCSGVASWSQEEVETEQGEGEHAPSAPIAPNLRVRLDQATKCMGSLSGAYLPAFSSSSCVSVRSASRLFDPDVQSVV